MKTMIPSHLSDDALVSEVNRLARGHRHTTAQLVAHLAELDARRLYLGAGFSSLFKYCREVLELSESEAYNRIEAARAARRFPVILERLAEGALNLTTVRLLARHLTNENHGELLDAATRKSKEEVDELVARHSPRPDVPSSIRRLPEPKPAPLPLRAMALQAPDRVMREPAVPIAPTVPPAATRRPVVAPLSPDRYAVRFTVSASTREKLRLAQDLLRHAVPTGDLAEIIDRALTALLEDLARKKFAATKRPRRTDGTGDRSRDIPARVPRTANGASTEDYVWLLGRANDAHESELFYGPVKQGEGSVKESSTPYGDEQLWGLVPERVLAGIAAIVPPGLLRGMRYGPARHRADPQ